MKPSFGGKCQTRQGDADMRQSTNDGNIGSKRNDRGEQLAMDPLERRGNNFPGARSPVQHSSDHVRIYPMLRP